MTTLLEIPLRDARPAVIESFQKKYPQAVLRIEADNSLHSGGMDEEQFWAVIEAFDWSKKESDQIMAPAVALLAAMPIVNIYLFADTLAEKLHQLDTRAHGDAYLTNEGDDYLSVDDFLYVRCAVVAEGKEFFEEVVANPAELPDLVFEPLLSLAAKAYKMKTGREFDYFTAVSYETFSNKRGWE